MSREKANARERCRQKSVGNAFNELRNHLPKQLRDRKPSKAETLKSATEYISHLLQILEKEMKPRGQAMNSNHTVSKINENANNGYQKVVWIPPESSFTYSNK